MTKTSGTDRSLSLLDGRVDLWCGDCKNVLPALPSDSIDSSVCDPPYHLHSIVKRFAKTGRTDKTRSKSGPHQRVAAGFMNKKWDGGDIAFQPALWAEVLRVLKPGPTLWPSAALERLGACRAPSKTPDLLSIPSSERETEYQADIQRRMKLCLAGPEERRRESIKAGGKTADAGPLFGGKV